MSVHFIIDGYNVVKQVPSFALKKLKNSREGLIQLIKKYKLTGSSKNGVTIVFDGQKDIIAPKIQTEFEVIFTEGESADDRIKKIIKSSPQPSRLIVVTDDKELIFFARNHRAIIYSTSKFLNKILKVKDTKKIYMEKFKLSPNIAREITEELKKIWLREDEDK
jgi:predicted RNA-binding protein with PIN domain